MPKCNICSKEATIDCDRCGHVRFCSRCYRKDMPECACTECISISRDCNFCADEWHKEHPDGTPLALVCPTCIKGYCIGCAINDNGTNRCPQCFDTLESKTDAELMREIESIAFPPGDLQSNKVEQVDEIDQFMQGQPARAEKVDNIDRLAELEAHLAELERLGNEGPHAPVAPLAPPARRRRRGPFHELPPVPIVLEDAHKVEVPKRVVVPRPDNVRPAEQTHTQLRRVTSDALIAAQTRNYLRAKYHISRPAEWLEEIYASKSEVIGSFPLEMMLGETFKDSDMDICATETAANRLAKQLTRDGYVCTVAAKKYAAMSEMKYVHHVETWELPYPKGPSAPDNDSQARIQFIIMTDMRHVEDYLAAADITVVQNRFNGREFHIGSEETLEWRGSVIGDWNVNPHLNLDRIVKYHTRGFRIMVPLTGQMIYNMMP